MSSSLTKKAKRNALSSYANFVISALLTFFLNPFLVKFLGIYEFGIWKSCLKYLDFASIADGRASQALKWIIANKEGTGSSIEEKQQAIGSAIRVWLYFLPGLFLILAILIYFLPNSIHNLPPSYNNIVLMTGVFLGLNILLNPLLEIPDAVMVGINQAHKSTITQTGWMILANICMVLVAYLGYGIIMMAVVIVVTTIIKGFNVLWVCTKNAKWFGVVKPEKNQVREFLGFSFWVLAWSFIARLLLASETILIGFLSGPDQVSKYVFSSYVSQLGVSIAMISGSAIIPSLGMVLGKGDLEKVRSIISIIREITFLVGIFFGSAILALNHGFVQLWMGNSFYMGDTINLCIVIIMIQLMLLRSESQIQDVSLNIRNKVIIGAIGSIFAVGFGIIFYYYIFDKSILGIFVGLFIGRLCISIPFPILVNKISSTRIQFNSKLFWGGAILFLSYILSDYIISDSWFNFIIKSILFLSSLSGLCFMLVLKKQSKKLYFERVFKKIGS